MIELLSFIPLGLASIGGIVWLVRLEGRVNTQDQKHSDLKELINVRFDALDPRLERIERALNGALKSHD